MKVSQRKNSCLGFYQVLTRPQKGKIRIPQAGEWQGTKAMCVEHHVTVGGATHPGQPSETDRDRPEEVRLKLLGVNLSTVGWEGLGFLFCKDHSASRVEYGAHKRGVSRGRYLGTAID